MFASHSPWGWPTSCSAGGSARQSPPEEQTSECRPLWQSASCRRTPCRACTYATQSPASYFWKWLSSLFFGLSWFPSVLPVTYQDSRQSSFKITSNNVVSDLDLLRYDTALSGKSPDVSKEHAAFILRGHVGQEECHIPRSFEMSVTNRQKTQVTPLKTGILGYTAAKSQNAQRWQISVPEHRSNFARNGINVVSWLAAGGSVSARLVGNVIKFYGEKFCVLRCYAVASDCQ